MANVRDWRGEDLSLSSFYFSIPLVTRYWISGACLLTVACGLGIVPITKVILDWDRVFQSAELWRPLAATFFLGPIGIGFFFDVVYLYRFSKALETGVFLGSAADYAWMLCMIDFFLLLVSAVLFPLPTLGRPLMMAVMHVWSRNFPHERVHVFVLAVPAAYLSFVLILMNTLLSGAVDIPGLVGVFCGHLFYFLHTVYPSLQSSQNRRIMKTPLFMYRLFGEQDRRRFGNQREAESRSSGETVFSQIRGRRWGTGHRLGSMDEAN